MKGDKNGKTNRKQFKQSENNVLLKKEVVEKTKKEKTVAVSKELPKDVTCLADGVVFPASFEKTGINLNEMIIGPTGSGKTYSVSIPRILHTYNASMVVPIAKKTVREKCATLLKKRGYNVIDLDFTHPEKCDVGYDPMDYIRNDVDVILSLN